MKSSSRLWAAGLILFSFIAASAAPRTWTDASGRYSVVAELIEVKDGTARLKKADGVMVAIQLDRLSRGDREYIQKLVSQPLTQRRKFPANGDAQAPSKPSDAAGSAPSQPHDHPRLVASLGHTNYYVTSVVFSPDGR